MPAVNADRPVMDKDNRPWQAALNIKDADLTDCPQGENPLLWALDSQLISEENYRNWASEHYEIPQLDPTFFALAVDGALPEKLSELYQWSAHCYPLYQWEGITYVACLWPGEPISGHKICWLVSDWSAMKSKWESLFPNAQAPQKKAPLAPPAPGPEYSEEITRKQQEPQTEQIQKPNEEFSFDDLSFDSLDSGEGPSSSAPTLAATKAEISPQAKVHSSPQPQDNSQNNFDELSFSGLADVVEEAHKLQGTDADVEFDDDATPPPENFDDEQTPPPEGMTNNIIELHPQQETSEESNPKSQAPPSPLTSSMGTPTEKELTPSPAPSLDEPLEFDLDPLETEEVQVPPPVPNIPKTHMVAKEAPAEYRIELKDMEASKDIDNCQSRKEVIQNFFYHLRRDFQSLMWITEIEREKYIPRYIYGPWQTAENTWGEPVELNQANIFSIAYNSQLPFHGAVANNSINQKYFDMWCQGDEPEQVSIFPVVIDKKCYGFVVGFNKGEDFEMASTLKKVENLISISSKTFVAAKAS